MIVSITVFSSRCWTLVRRLRYKTTLPGKGIISYL